MILCSTLSVHWADTEIRAYLLDTRGLYSAIVFSTVGLVKLKLEQILWISMDISLFCYLFSTLGLLILIIFSIPEWEQ